MLKIIISGCNGHMGRVVESLCAADPQVEVVAGFDVLGSTTENSPFIPPPLSLPARQTPLSTSPPPPP